MEKRGSLSAVVLGVSVVWIAASSASVMGAENWAFDLGPQSNQGTLAKAFSNFKADRQVAPFFNSDPDNSLMLAQRVSGSGVETTKLQHYYHGLEVIGSMAFHHASERKVQVRNSLRKFDLETNPTLSQEDAVLAARASSGGDRLLTAVPVLKILPTDPGSAQLVYEIHLGGSGPRSEGRLVFVEAHQGKIVGNLSTHETMAPIEVYNANNMGSNYSFVINPKTQQPSSCTITNLANGKVTKKLGNACKQVNESQCQLLLDGDPVEINPSFCNQEVTDTQASANSDPASIRALENSKTVLNYYQSHHSRNGYDDQGSKVVSVVHVGVKYDNAHWDVEKSQMAYGDGDGSVLGDFTNSLDVAGHEMTHGVTESTAKLVMMGESGALNEANSDFFGIMVAGSQSGNYDWGIGRGLFLQPGANSVIRDLADPTSHFLRIPDANGNLNKVAYPANIQDMFPIADTCDESNDFCWVHENATIQGHASYLIAQSLGVAATEKLFYLVLTQGLSARDTLTTAAATYKQMCRHLYDETTCQKVDAAYQQVGL